MRHPHYLILICFLTFGLLPLSSYSQRLEEFTKNIAISLLNAGVDTVIIYNPYSCPTQFRPTDTSVVEDISYSITKKLDLLSIERLTYEYKNNSGLIVTHNFIYRKDSLGIFKFLNANFNSLASDSLLPGMLKWKINGKDTLIRDIGSHPCYTELVVRTRSKTFRNGFINMDLTDGIIHNEDGSIRYKQESVNYEYNTSTSIYKIMVLLQILEEEIKKTYEF